MTIFSDIAKELTKENIDHPHNSAVGAINSPLVRSNMKIMDIYMNMIQYFRILRTFLALKFAHI